MPTKKRVRHKANAATGSGYRGKQAKTGNSLGFRFDKALFQSHPEFAGEVRGHVLGPGSMLVVVERPQAKPRRREEDPVLKSFLSFLANDIAAFPERIRPFSRDLAARIQDPVGDVAVDPNEELGDDPLV